MNIGYAIGQILTEKDLNFLANGCTFTEHALKRIQERLGNATYDDIQSLIIRSDFAFVNEYDSAIISIGEGYFVMGLASRKIITVVTSPSNYTLQEVWLRALNGHTRSRRKKQKFVIDKNKRI